MVENTAFKLFEVWWEERKKSEKGVPLAVTIPSNNVNNAATAAAVAPNDASAATAAAATAPTNNAIPTAAATAAAKEEPKNQGLASLLEQAATPLGLNYDGFGLGIRASMPKMPSFRVKCQDFFTIKLILLEGI